MGQNTYKMTVEEIIQNAMPADAAIEEILTAPFPDAKAKKVAKKAKKAKKVAKKAKKSKKSSKSKSKKSRKARKSKKQTKTQKRRSARKANKSARHGKTVAQCVVAVIKTNKRSMTAKGMAKAVAKKGIKVSNFVLGKVLVQLNRRRVLKKTKSGYKLTGRPLPKARTLAQKQAAMAKARRALKKKARKSVKKAGKKAGKKAKKSKKAKKAKKSRK